MTLQINSHGKLQHLLTINELPISVVKQILDVAQSIISNNQLHIRNSTLLKDITIANLFFEPSTRTRASFELAAKRLGATTINIEGATSSLVKGETVLDTVKTLHAMKCDAFVIRHSKENTARDIAHYLNEEAHVINAGDGIASHPTQALLDALTIRQRKPDFSSLSVAIIGDIAHSRVARSQIEILKLLGVKKIRLIGPDEFLPVDKYFINFETTHDLKKGLADIDVVSLLRIQKERIDNSTTIDFDHYVEHFSLNQKTLAFAKPDAIVLHPGPMNRGIEISDDVADGDQSLILDQVRNGVAIRMAIIKLLFSIH